MDNFASREFNSIVIGGSLLAANAGFINVITLTGVFSVTVSHLTGNVSRVAIALFNADITTLMLVTSICFSFSFGSFIAGLMVGDHKFRLGQSYGYALLIESACLFASFIFLRRELVVGEWCAAFACGLQNALATSYSGAVVRTTHMTGIITDIGNIIGQACRRDSKAETWRLKVHIPLLLSYLVGGMVGQASYLVMKENSLLLPCFFTGGVACVYLMLPMVKQAAEMVKAAAEATLGAQPAVEVRFVGDPRTNDVFQKVQGRDVDIDIKNFLSDVDDEDVEGGQGGSSRAGGKGLAEGVEMSQFGGRRESSPKTPRVQALRRASTTRKPSLSVSTAPLGQGEYKAHHAGGSVEVLYSASPQPSSANLLNPNQ
ncbi:hypothetical protein HK104_003336 [Borealophlyctis nickersoniae]|nr:hypothetical protein HK104_003336 [Borealophlyctis nickersoniae]